MGKLNVAPDAFAIMTVDPGKATGVAQGVFRNLGSVERTLGRAVAKRTVRATVTDRDVVWQAHELATTWRDFKFRCVVELGISELDVFLVVEDFQLRQMAVDLVPVEVFVALRAVQRVPTPNGWHDDCRDGLPIRMSASEAKTFATDDRMRHWGSAELSVYQLGCEADRRGTGRLLGDHARAALKHLCLGVNKCLEGKWSIR